MSGSPNDEDLMAVDLGGLCRDAVFHALENSGLKATQGVTRGVAVALGRIAYSMARFSNADLAMLQQIIEMHPDDPKLADMIATFAGAEAEVFLAKIVPLSGGGDA